MISLEYAAQMLSGNPRFEWVSDWAWDAAAAVQPAGYHLAGFPGEWQDEDVRRLGNQRSGRIEACLACVPIERIPWRPAEEDEAPEFWQDRDAFYGRVLPTTNDRGQVLQDMDGISGGPLFSVELKDGFVQRQLYGMQSAWLPSKRIMRAVSIGTMMKMMSPLETLTE